MKRFDEADDPRRRLLIQALAAGMFSGLPGSSLLAAGILGSRPTKLPEGQSIYFLSGKVTVNGMDATIQTRIVPGDTVETGPTSEVIFVVNSHSMIVRANSRLVIEAGKKTGLGALFITGLRVLSGRLLSVSRDTSMQVRTATATIGIRGTGFYIESDPEQTYFCTCYGVTEVAANADPTSRETVAAQHHDRPLYILGKADAGRSIRDAPFINHTDQELTLIETLVGRTPPFVFLNDSYTGPRRDY